MFLWLERFLLWKLTTQAEIFSKWFLGKSGAFSSQGLGGSLLGSESHLTKFPGLAPISVCMPISIAFYRFCTFYSPNVSFENKVQILRHCSDFLWVRTVGRHGVIKAHMCKRVWLMCTPFWLVSDLNKNTKPAEPRESKSIGKPF